MATRSRHNLRPLSLPLLALVVVLGHLSGCSTSRPETPSLYEDRSLFAEAAHTMPVYRRPSPQPLQPDGLDSRDDIPGVEETLFDALDIHPDSMGEEPRGLEGGEASVDGIRGRETSQSEAQETRLGEGFLSIMESMASVVAARAVRSVEAEESAFRLQEARDAARAGEGGVEAKLVSYNLDVLKSRTIHPTNIEDKEGALEEGALPEALRGEWPEVGGEPVEINVEQMPLPNFVELAFGRILRLNYRIDPKVQEMRAQSVSMRMTDPVAPEVFLQLVVGLLQERGVSVTPEEGGLHVHEARRADGRPPAPSLSILVGRSLPPDVPPRTRITIFYPARYLPVQSLTAPLGIFIRDEMERVHISTLYSVPAIMITGEAGRVEQILGLLRLLDQPWMTERSVGLLRLEYMPAEEFVKNVQTMLPGLGIPLAGWANQRPGIELIPIERGNMVVIISQEAEWLHHVAEWGQRLDVPESLGEQARLFIFRPRSRPAEEIIAVLESVMVDRGEGDSQLSKVTETSKSGDGANLMGFSTFGDARFALDRERNCIVIQAYPQDYRHIRRLLSDLDTEPMQVLIEMTIAEVTLTDNFAFGVDWFFKEQIGTQSPHNLEFGTAGTMGLGGNAFNFSYSGLNGDLIAQLNAYAKDNQIKVLSRPHLVVLNGHDASVNFGKDVPVVESERSTTDTQQGTAPSILRNINYRKTGVDLTVSPLINSDGYLTLKITQNLSEAQTNDTSKIDSPIILDRALDTILSLRSGETVILGGLISENRSTTINKVPLLGDIPLVRRAFSTESKTTSRTELLIQITPHIITQSRQLEHFTRHLESRMNVGWRTEDQNRMQIAPGMGCAPSPCPPVIRGN